MPSLRVDAGPRRTDGAFARAVIADVARHRAQRRLVFPGLAVLAAGAAAVVVVVAASGEPNRVALSSSSTETVAASADAAGAALRPAEPSAWLADEADDEEEAVAVLDLVGGDDDEVPLGDELDDAALLALGDDDAGDAASGSAPAFAWTALDGSTDRELVAVERALDIALAREL